ncbi:hypothetical protein DPMN_109827 [Dreissena polymorpha]|uniref:Uncharacterized protein n=1 Tax=Dreissena polymorpha TaxID=45954 RepID=A0A9D4KBS0_DREPO|nr:hypothetical protein DPMN_109827 [Dreissena polymorpha]
MEHEHDNPGQYSRRNILRFHNVPMNGKPQSDTDQVIIIVCREKLGLPNLAADDIESSHYIGQPDKNGNAQIICKFKHWTAKNAVYHAKKELKKHKSESFNVFVCEDLPKRLKPEKRNLSTPTGQTIWTNDGRIFYKKTLNGPKTLEAVSKLFPIVNLLQIKK